MPCVFSAAMSHAPLTVPSISGTRAGSCARTTAALREIARQLVAAGPDRVVVITPHGPRRPERFGAYLGAHRGSLARFGAPEVSLSLPDAPEVAEQLGLPPIHGEARDHGALVPLWFAWEAAWRGPTAILSVPWSPAAPESVGRMLDGIDGRTAVIASGDLSHRLTAEAPAGYLASGSAFDAAVVAVLEAGRWEELAGFADRAAAAEDVVDALRVALGASPGPRAVEVLSYECPFGVGYLAAILARPRDLALARSTQPAATPQIDGSPPV